LAAIAKHEAGAPAMNPPFVGHAVAFNCVFPGNACRQFTQGSSRL